jgi:hypothetical protein
VTVTKGQRLWVARRMLAMALRTALPRQAGSQANWLDS